MYAWLNKHFKLGLPTPIVEEDYPRLTAAELTVWDDCASQAAGRRRFRAHACCAGGMTTPRRNSPRSSPATRRPGSGIGRWLAGRSTWCSGPGCRPGARCGSRRPRPPSKTSFGPWPACCATPRRAASCRWWCWSRRRPGRGSRYGCSRDGKAGLFAADGKPHAAVGRLLDAGVTVVGADLIYQGEFLAHGQTLDKTRRVENPREAAAYTFGYNPAVFAQRVQDVVSVDPLCPITTGRRSRPAGGPGRGRPLGRRGVGAQRTVPSRKRRSTWAGSASAKSWTSIRPTFCRAGPSTLICLEWRPWPPRRRCGSPTTERRRPPSSRPRIELRETRRHLPPSRGKPRNARTTRSHGC